MPSEQQSGGSMSDRQDSGRPGSVNRIKRFMKAGLRAGFTALALVFAPHALGATGDEAMVLSILMIALIVTLDMEMERYDLK